MKKKLFLLSKDHYLIRNYTDRFVRIGVTPDGGYETDPLIKQIDAQAVFWSIWPLVPGVTTKDVCKLRWYDYVAYIVIRKHRDIKLSLHYLRKAIKALV